LTAFSEQLGSFARGSGERLDAIRVEYASSGKQLREEVIVTLNTLTETMSSRSGELASSLRAEHETLSKQLGSFAQASETLLERARSESAIAARNLREEVILALKGIAESTTTTMAEISNLQKVQLEGISSALSRLTESNNLKLEAMQTALETKLEKMRLDNATQLDQMRHTVDERLQGTLERRLGESFKLVSERLEQVHKGIGEMQSLAAGVGDLKKVLTNVRTRGTWGEVQLGALLEQVLSPDQFAANVPTKDGGERVEFAVKLPGQGDNRSEPVWLPIDAKFPLEDYQRLLDAQERVDVHGVELSGKQLEDRVKACASEISQKYLNPPKTTDFAILFLPTEGLFAEVLRRPGLLEAVQREHRVVIAGPTTLWSVLTSLQMGFRTLAIQKRSGEVWNLLGAVKTEWTRYGEILDAVQRKLHQASDTLEKARVRSRAVGRKLREVQELPLAAADALLPVDCGGSDAGNDEDEANDVREG
jgi:DNA recombination protein RmuC